MHRCGSRFLAAGLTLIASSFLFVSDSSADIVYLKDGSKVEGEIVQKTDAGWVVKTLDGKTEKIPADRVKSFEAKRNGPGTGGDDPLARLNSLRRSVDSQTDIPKIIERYRKFIEQNMGTPVTDEAVKDVAMWEDRLDKQMVKVGDKWVTKADQEAIKQKGVERAIEARHLLLANRAKEANAAIDAAIAENPSNAAAFYLRGVSAFRQSQMANARKAFDSANQLSLNHGPTFNNLAVIMWNAKQLPGSLNSYGQAMNAMPGNRQILDNVAEALNELPEAQRDNASTKKVVLLFNAQDMALQAKMKKQGLFRWGSTWVEEKDLNALKQQEQKIEDKLDALEDEYKTGQDRIDQIDRDVADTERSIRRIEAASYGAIHLAGLFDSRTRGCITT